MFVFYPESPSDYSPLMKQLVEFDACELLKCVEVDIIDDKVTEKTESFGVNLERTPDLDSRVTLTQVDGVVEVRDDDGKSMD